MTQTQAGEAKTPLITDLDIMLVLESVLINDEVINVVDAHRAMVALRDHYERQLAQGAGWLPLESGIYKDITTERATIEIRADMLIVGNRMGIVTTVLTDDVRLCRLAAGKEANHATD